MPENRSNILNGTLIVFSAMAGLLLMVTTAQAGSFKKQYKLQVNVGPSYYWGIGASRFADLVRSKTGGRIRIKPYFGSTMLKGAQLKSAQMVAKARTDMAD